MSNPIARALIAVTAAACVLSACSSAATEENDKTVTIGTLAWEESLAVTAVWKNVLEDQGFTVEEKQLDAGPAYQALAAGQIDVFPEQWPNYFRDYIEKYDDKLEKLGTWYEGTDINLAVPDYVTDVNSIADLAAHADEFNNEIIGIEAGSETIKVLNRDVVPHYGLDDLKVQTSSTPAMLASLEDAIAKKEPVVVTLWRPHWAFTKYPIRALEDPDEKFGGVGVIETVANHELSDRAPEAARILGNFALTSDQLGELELAIQAADNDADAGAATWIDDNRDLVDSWIKD